MRGWQTPNVEYISEANLRTAADAAVDVYIPPDREYHGVRAGAGPPRSAAAASRASRCA